MMIFRACCLVAVVGLLGLPAAAQASENQEKPAAAESDAAALAMKLSNPVASLVSIPFQANWDFGVGPEDGRRFVMNFQPVMPFELNDDWNLITRIVAPIIGQPALTMGGDSTFGIGDTAVSMFFSPKRGKVIWGVGPVVALPITSDPALGTGRFSVGPTFVVLKQSGAWTYGALANQLWSVAGDDGRADVSRGFLQPFVSYTTGSATSFSLNSEATYDWEADTDEWTIPFNLSVSKILKLGRTPISVGFGIRYYAETPAGGPDWGFRVPFTILLPTGK